MFNVSGVCFLRTNSRKGEENIDISCGFSEKQSWPVDWTQSSSGCIILLFAKFTLTHTWPQREWQSFTPRLQLLHIRFMDTCFFTLSCLLAPLNYCDFLVLPCTATNIGKAKTLIRVPLNFTGPPFNETFIHIQQQAFDLVFCLLSQEQ